MARTPAQIKATRAAESRKRASGLREIRVWVSDRDKFGLDDEKQVRDLAAALAARRGIDIRES
jgi:hypothetical protein